MDQTAAPSNIPSNSNNNNGNKENTLSPGFIKTKLQDLWQLGVNYVENTKQKVENMGPLPDNFDYNYAVKYDFRNFFSTLSIQSDSYVAYVIGGRFQMTMTLSSYCWRTIMMIAHTLGLRLGDTTIGSKLISTFFSTVPLGLLTFIIIPTHALLFHKKTPEKDFSFLDRRVLLTGIAFCLGICVSFLTRHYLPPVASPPVYFMPAVVGIAIQIIGPQFRNNRKMFLATTVGSASFLAFLISNYVGMTSLAVLLTIFHQTMIGIFNVQVIVYDVSKGDTDMTSAHIIGLAISMFCHTANKVLFCTYDPNRLSNNYPSVIDTAVL